MKIYTKTGDKGETSLATGVRVGKDDIRIEAYGTVDELNSFMGLFRDELIAAGDFSAGDNALVPLLVCIQNDLFNIGAELATPPGSKQIRLVLVDQASIECLETSIDTFNGNLPPLRNFILPGGHRLNSLAHILRTITRRAERLVVQLSRREQVRPELVKYLNRLSDWFFIVSRALTHRFGSEEVLWSQKGGLKP